MTQQHNNERADLKNQHQNEKNNLSNKHQNEKDNLNKKHANEMAKAKTPQEKAALQKKHDRENAALNKKHQNETNKLNNKHQNEVNKMNERHNKEQRAAAAAAAKSNSGQGILGAASSIQGMIPTSTGPGNGGPTNTGPTNTGYGPTNTGPTNTGYGPTNTGYGPTNEGPTNGGPTNEGPTNEGPTNEGPTISPNNIPEDSSVASNGTLLDADGNPVLDANGRPIKVKKATSRRSMPGLPASISSISANNTRGIKLPGKAIEISPKEYKAESLELDPYVISWPPKLDTESGLLVAYFTAQVGDAYKYYKIYGQTPQQIEEYVNSFHAEMNAEYSPQANFNTSLNKTTKEVKNSIETLDLQIDKLKGSFKKAPANAKQKNAQIIELLEDRRERLTGELNAALRVAALD